MKKVVITGVTGFIGSAVARKLLDSGIIVYGVDIEAAKFAPFLPFKNFKPIVADFKKYQELHTMILDRDIDVFYHFAWAGGFTTAIRDYKLQMENAGYAGDAVAAAKNMECKKFVYAATYNQYEIQTFLAAKQFEPRYTCIYAIGKTAADLICRTLAYNLGMEYCGGMIPMPYGEGNYSKQLANVVINCLNKGEIPKLVEGNNLYDMVYIDDIAGAFKAIGERGLDQEKYYVGHRRLKTFKEWMISIRDILAPDMILRFGEYQDKQNIDYSLIDLDALYRDTGFECTADFEETIRRTAEWVQENFDF